MEVNDRENGSVILRTQGQEGVFDKITVPLDRIESIYPISEFPQ